MRHLSAFCLTQAGLPHLPILFFFPLYCGFWGLTFVFTWNKNWCDQTAKLSPDSSLVTSRLWSDRWDMTQGPAGLFCWGVFAYYSGSKNSTKLAFGRKASSLFNPSFQSGTATFSKTWILLYTQQKTVVGRDTDGMLLKRQQSLCRRLDFTSRDLLNNNPGAGFLNLAPHFNIFNTLISLLCAKTISKLWRLFARGCNCVKL